MTKIARSARAVLSPDPGRAGGDHLGAPGRQAGAFVGCCLHRLRNLEPAHPDRRPQPLAGYYDRAPPAARARRIKLRYITQAKTRPPSFAIFCSRPTKLLDSYLRYLENALRDDFDLPGTPIRLTLRKGENPYAPKKK